MKPSTGKALLLRADARELPIADGSVDLVVTSPPFLNLRSYTDGGAHYRGQIGAGTRDQYLEDLWQVTAECARVLKPTGSMFVELGDSYTAKTLNLSPHRYAIGCIDKLGMLLRAEIIWDRPNGLPESVTDRVRRSHSVWFHLVKQPRYFSAVDQIREAHAPDTFRATKVGPRAMVGRNTNIDHDAGAYAGPNPLGKLPGSVWNIPTEPLSVPDHLGVDHFAAFPTEWPRRIILGWSPSGICTACGEGRRPVSATTLTKDRGGSKRQREWGSPLGLNVPLGSLGRERVVAITGEACACTPYTDHPGTGESSGPSHAELVAAGNGYSAFYDTPGPPSRLSTRPKTGPWREYHFDRWTPAPTRPSVILDPFGGTGTTALVAKALGRVGITVDRSGDYSRLAKWRTSDPGQLAKAMRVERPPVEHVGQLDLFAEEAS